MSYEQKGFTLIELIVSIGILSILSIFIMTTLDPLAQFQKGEDARRKADLSHIQKELEAYYQDNGKYPLSTGEPNYYMTTSDQIDPVKEWGTMWDNYMDVLPQDTATRDYIYNASLDGQSYWIYASLERGDKDPQSCANTGNAKSSEDETCSNVPDDVFCGESNICNYGVSSPNVSP